MFKQKHALQILYLVWRVFGNLSGFKLLGDPLGFDFRGFGSALFEFINGAGHVDQVLLAGIERMAVGANFNMELFFSRAGGKDVAAGADDLGFGEVLGVEIVFHPS